MLDTFKTLLVNQFEASFCTLQACVDRCPAAAWNAPVAKYPFCQVVFHTLFFADFYLGDDEHAFRREPFHVEHRNVFADYEQMEYREPTGLYERDWITLYLDYCRGRAARTIAAETSESLGAVCGFPPKKFSRGELHVYSIRHVQHHAAQLSLRLRLDYGVDIPWIGSGWRQL